MTPAESTDSGRVVAVLLSVKWPDGGHERLPTRRTADMLAEALTASDWLADVVAQAKAEALREAADDYTNSVGGTKARPHARQWLRERADRIEATP